ncbi:DNA topoisomerase I [hydrothermal vent metagenome]|uniref:DNA topoisomerase n=1 Tax=hydrothermal vent metagenome TaxID=652676 RepID=A0A3B1EA99_9ZZZZ
MKNLVIVESPAKARTITKFLGKDYTVMASMGHVRDLPKSSLGFDPDNNFKPKYQITKDKSKIISDLKKNINKNTVIYLAADEDREGEAIAWHLIPALKIEKNPIKRIVFHEITKSAILDALDNPREVDQHLVDAQQARRILDRAVGYKLSPLLWKKVRFGLSAGRVQSVAVRMIVEKEREIKAFNPVEFWKIKLDFTDPSFRAELARIDGKTTKVKNKQEAQTIQNSCELGEYLLENIEAKQSKRNPAPPFTTSTLQQEASRKAGFSVKQTMIVAQQLYEGGVTIPNHTGGLITYMRTDSVNLSKTATDMAKEVITIEYSKEYALDQPRHYKSKAKGAQEAHEAIRPVNLHLKPSDVQPYLDHYQYKLYSLIWKRTIATQMAQAVVANTTYKITAGKSKEYEFQAKGTKIVFAGFMKAYTEGSDDPEAALDNTEKFLPNVEQNTKLKLKTLETEQNFTKPPARYTEASLVKKMESEGIGRPSTYAPTISTIQARDYVIKTEDKKLAPAPIGEVVNDFLVEHFPDIINLCFTSNIEEQFDDIAEGKIKWETVMQNFYGDFVKKIEDKEENAPRAKFAQARELGCDPKTGKKIFASTGKYGAFVQLGHKDDIDENKKEIKPKFASLSKGQSVDKINLEEALVLLQLPKVLGSDKNGDDVKVNIGRFGPYVQIKSEYFSLKLDDPYTIDLQRALEVVQEIRKVKEKALLKDFPDDDIKLLIGRYGPYIKQGKKNFKLPKKLDEQDIKALDIKEVKEIIKNQPVGRAKRPPAKKKTSKSNQ